MEFDIQHLQEDVPEDDRTLAVVLWLHSAGSPAPSILLEQVQQESKHRLVALIAADGTWRIPGAWFTVFLTPCLASACRPTLSCHALKLD
jgi:hypothetical protein